MSLSPVVMRTWWLSGAPCWTTPTGRSTPPSPWATPHRGLSPTTGLAPKAGQPITLAEPDPAGHRGQRSSCFLDSTHDPKTLNRPSLHHRTTQNAGVRRRLRSPSHAHPAGNPGHALWFLYERVWARNIRRPSAVGLTSPSKVRLDSCSSQVRVRCAGKRSCVGVDQIDGPDYNHTSQIDRRIAGGLHRLETIEKSAFGRKTLSHPGYGPKYGL